MSGFLPSMSSLRAFEASARHLSFSRAAEELHLTQSAISRQVIALENFVGVKLFCRAARRLELTEAGAEYASEVRRALLEIEHATRGLRVHATGNQGLDLAVLPVFGTKWLIPRMPDFWRRHPGISANLLKAPVPFDFSSERFDAAILFGSSPWPSGVIAHRLMPERFVVVCAPGLLRCPGLDSISDLSRHTLLQHSTLPHAWKDWLAAAGHGGAHIVPSGPLLERFSLALAAAMAGKGVALLPRFMVEQAVSSKQLVIRFDISLPQSYAYYLVYPEEKRDMPALASFRDWVHSEVTTAEE